MPRGLNCHGAFVFLRGLDQETRRLLNALVTGVGTACAKPPPVESTRIIPIAGGSVSGWEQPSNIIRMEPDAGLIKIVTAQGRETITGGDGESGQRFSSEVKYVSYFAQRLADTLGMRQLEFGIVEDGAGQTAFQSAPGGWQGVVSGSRKSVKHVKESLARG